MSEKQTDLFQEFRSVSQAEWESKIEKDLKGKGLDSLLFKPEFDLEAKANYHVDEFESQAYSKTSNLNADNNDWAISQMFIDDRSKETNKLLLEALNKGCSGLKIYITDHTSFQDLFEEVLIEHIFTHVIVRSTEQYKKLISYLSSVNQKLSIIEMPFLTDGLKLGRLNLNQLDIDNFIADSSDYCVKSLLIDGYSFCQFGASSAQELGITLSMLNEYIQRLTNQNISADQWATKIAIHLGVTDNYFVNIAKFRAIKELVLQLKSQWGLGTDAVPWVSAETVERHITKNDRHNNVLRQTSSAMSAVLGGVSQLIIRSYAEVTENDLELSTRLAKNIQLVLKEESYFHQVIDPSAGAYVIESLTDQLIEKGWTYLMEIEQQGGYYDALESGYIHRLIEDSKNEQIKALNNRTKTLLGVNKFKNTTENWQLSSNSKPIDSIDFKAFSTFNLESNFEIKAEV